MLQLHQSNAFRHICRLFRVEWQRFACQRITKLAGACADLPTDHESGRPPTPALAHVRAFSTGADRMQAMRLHNRFRAGKLFVPAQTNFEPIRFPQMFCHALTNFQTGSSPSWYRGGNGCCHRKCCDCDLYRRAYQTAFLLVPMPRHNPSSA